MQARNRSRHIGAALVLLALLPAGASLATDRDELARRATDPITGAFPAGWALGPGVYYSSSLYESVDSQVIPVPTVYFRGKHCAIYVSEGACEFFEWKFLELEAIADLRLDGYDADDSDFLAGMEDRDFSVNGGLGVGFQTPIGDFEMEALHDLLGEHDGYEIGVGWAAPIVLERSVLRFALTHHWRSSDMAGHYYGVEPDEAVPGRPAYRVGSASLWTGVFHTNWRVSRRWLMVAQASYERYSSEIRDSPIIESSGQFKGLFGLAYKFGK
jgi:outer membrane protein